MDPEKLFGGAFPHVKSVEFLDQGIAGLIFFPLCSQSSKVDDIVEICSLVSGVVSFHPFDHSVQKPGLVDKLKEEVSQFI